MAKGKGKEPAESAAVKKLEARMGSKSEKGESKAVRKAEAKMGKGKGK